MQSYLDFEKPIADLEGKIAELKSLSDPDKVVSIDDEVAALTSRADQALADIYKKLSPWQRTQVARHPQRPHFSDYVKALVTDWTPLAGDRKYGEDPALQAGFGRFKGAPIAVLGQEKGSDTSTRLAHNFGMANPEGYRKAVRIMDMADRFNIPVVSLVDTAGAYPGPRGRRARPGRGDRALHGKISRDRRSEPRHHHRRGRVGRRHRHRDGQPRADARARDLQRDLAGIGRLDPVQGSRQGHGNG